MKKQTTILNIFGHVPAVARGYGLDLVSTISESFFEKQTIPNPILKANLNSHTIQTVIVGRRNWVLFLGKNREKTDIIG